MAELVQQQNLMRYVELLEHESDAARRGALQQMFLEAEDRFGGRRERLEQTESFILKGRDRIQRQREIVSTLPHADGDAERARTVLVNLLRTQSLFEAYRQVLLERLDGPGPGEERGA